MEVINVELFINIIQLKSGAFKQDEREISLIKPLGRVLAIAIAFAFCPCLALEKTGDPLLWSTPVHKNEATIKREVAREFFFLSPRKLHWNVSS